MSLSSKANGAVRAFYVIASVGLSGLFSPLAAQILQNLPLSPRNANYEIRVDLDPEQQTLTGWQRVTWRNLQERPTDELRLHLYWNAWRNNRSTWLREDTIRERSSLEEEDVRQEDWGWIDVDEVLLIEDQGSSSTPLSWEPISPDDGNVHDRTVMKISLPRFFGAGETVQFEMRWTSRIPRVFARTGRHGDFYLFAHWNPTLGVYEEDGWNCHQFHAATEFYADYGVYDVQLTLPERYVLGATGREVSRQDHPDGQVTYRYRQADVHNFAWTASPSYVVLERDFEAADLPSVKMRLLLQPEHRGQADRHFDATRFALENYGRWYGAYPYDQLTIVDPAYGSGTGGMEYPTLFTTGTRRFNPPGADSPEGVTVHEAGHQFWYGMVGNNEFEDAWLDEGLNTYSTIRTLEESYGPRILTERYLEGYDGRGFLPVRFPDIEVSRWARRMRRYRDNPSVDNQKTPTYLTYPANAAVLPYDKTALWLATLERHLGWPKLQEILSTFFSRYRFAHPSGADFIAVANEVAGQDLNWFFDQAYADSVVFDYAILTVKSEQISTRGWVEQAGRMVYVGDDGDEADASEDGDDDADGTTAGEDEPIYHTEVVVQRWGGGRFPVEIELVFEDGERIIEPWDGQARWKMIELDRPSKLAHAVVDPQQILMLDVRRRNNSRLLEPADTLPASKWASKWMIWLQDMMSTITFFL